MRRSLPQLSLVDFSVLDFATGTVRSLAPVGWKLARSKNNLHQPLSSRSSGDDVNYSSQTADLTFFVVAYVVLFGDSPVVVLFRVVAVFDTYVHVHGTRFFLES